MRSLLLLLASATSVFAADLQWFKGNTHTHTLWSDGNDFPEMVADWYVQHGYQFLAFTDHNLLHAQQVWMSEPAIEKRRKALGKTTVQKYLARFGTEWVQQREQDGVKEIRLRQLEEYRPLFEKPGSFLLIQAEEISAKQGKTPLHLNAINLASALQPVTGANTVETLRANLQAVMAQEKETGRPILVHINHPNFQWALTAEELAAVVEDQFFEIFNGHPSINYLGDDKHPGCERIWDVANTLRMTTLKAPPLYGVATDDSHHYHGETASPGRGWVMVRSEKLEAASLIKAMRAGDFYASSGVTLDTLSVTGKTLSFTIKAKPGVSYTTRIVGTAASAPQDPGRTFATLEGATVSYTPAEDVLYLRAIITSTAPHPNPSYPDQTEMAWIQPWAVSLPK